LREATVEETSARICEGRDSSAEGHPAWLNLSPALQKAEQMARYCQYLKKSSNKWLSAPTAQFVHA
jgi:hypothetical protein